MTASQLYRAGTLAKSQRRTHAQMDNAEQVEQYDLPTKPRKATDRRSQEIAYAVEAESLPASILRSLLRAEVEALLPEGALAVAKVAEQSERAHLRQMANLFDRGQA